MGVAKRRALAREQLDKAIELVDIPRLAAAIRKLATAASSHFGGDCYIHAAIAQALLARMGVEAKLRAGWAAWRVGEMSGSVILHANTPGMIDQPGGVAYHVWLEVGNNILDLTTYQLREKAAQLDRLDGGTTDVTWCPEYLFILRKTISSLRDVTQLRAGMYYYEQNPAVETKIILAAPELDEEDVQMAWILYQNKDLAVFGPNNSRVKDERDIVEYKKKSAEPA